MAKSGRLLIVDDEEVALRNLEHIMQRAGYNVTTASSGAEALVQIEAHEFDLLLTDLRMENVDGMQLLKACRQRQPDAEVIMITGYATAESAVKAMKEGAFHYIAKPFRLDEVRRVVAEALEKVALKRENQALREQLDRVQGRVKIITQDTRMQKLLEMVRQIGPTGCNVVITGESGTGKELFARYLHEHGGRADGPFVAVNCGAFNEELLANELFGNEKGAFTGATGKPGLIETANGGTLFLDEVTEMSTAMQVKLLRVIQEREVLRLGGTRTSKVDVRFCAATNRDVPALVQGGRFRQDLYFRLNVVNVHIPPLSERRDDIPLLAYHFLSKYSGLMRKTVNEIAPAVLDLLQVYDFPGNVRELENIIERAVAICTGHVIETEHLPAGVRALPPQAVRSREGHMPTLEEQGMEYIQQVLKETNGNQTLAAEILGINRVSLWRKLKRHNLEDA
jgi:DNA-binding NtrC family response regulator